MNKRSYLVLIVIALTAICSRGVMAVGWPVVAIVGGSAWLAVLAWYKTTYQVPAPAIVLPIYLLTLAALMLHMAEEYHFGFAPAMSQLFGLNFTQDKFVLTFATIGPAIWILGAVGLYYKNPFGHFIAWFIFIGPGCLEFMHYIFPLIAGGSYHYFPGMYTAWLPMVPGLYGIYHLLSSHRLRAITA